MGGSYILEEPHVLITLPRPIDTVKGHTYVGPCCSFRGSPKRKRAEVVTGVDGECVSIYNVRSPRAVT